MYADAVALENKNSRKLLKVYGNTVKRYMALLHEFTSFVIHWQLLFFTKEILKRSESYIFVFNRLTVISIFENDEISIIPTPSRHALCSSRINSKKAGL